MARQVRRRSVTLHLQVPDADAAWDRAVAAGAEVRFPMRTSSGVTAMGRSKTHLDSPGRSGPRSSRRSNSPRTSPRPLTLPEQRGAVSAEEACRCRRGSAVDQSAHAADAFLARYLGAGAAHPVFTQPGLNRTQATPAAALRAPDSSTPCSAPPSTCGRGTQPPPLSPMLPMPLEIAIIFPLRHAEKRAAELIGRDGVDHHHRLPVARIGGASCSRMIGAGVGDEQIERPVDVEGRDRVRIGEVQRLDRTPSASSSALELRAVAIRPSRQPEY